MLIASTSTDWLLIALGLVAMNAWGIPMIFRGGSAWRKFGPRHPVQIVAPRRLLGALLAAARGDSFHHKMPARTAFLLGGFFAFLSLSVFPAVFGLDAVNPWAISRRADSGCGVVITAEDLDALGGWQAELTRVVDDGSHCHATWSLGARAELSVDLGPGGSFSAGTLAERRRRNARSRDRGSVSTHGDDALRVTSSVWDTVYGDFDGLQLRLQTSPGTLSKSQIDALLDRARDRCKRLGRYR